MDFSPTGSIGTAQPGTDPQYLAILRALGFDDAMLRQQGAMNVGNVQERLGFEIPRIQALGVREREGIAGGYETRGILRSGDHLRANAEQRADEQYRVGNLYLTGAQDIRGMEFDLARQLADLERRKAEAALNAGAGAYQSQNTPAVY